MSDLYSYGENKYSGKEFSELIKKRIALSGRDSRLSAVLSMVEGDTILDLGCNVGILSRVLAERGKNVLAIDISKDAIDKANLFNRTKNLRYLFGDIHKMELPDNKFDSVLFLEVLEHVGKPEIFLEEFLRILKPGGCLIISTPNALSYINILYNLLFFSRKTRLSFIDSLIKEPRNTGSQLDHICSWDFRTLLRFLVRSGFEYSEHKFAGAYPFGIRIAGHRLNILGNKELRFLLPILGPYLTTLVVKVKKPYPK